MVVKPYLSPGAFSFLLGSFRRIMSPDMSDLNPMAFASSLSVGTSVALYRSF